MIKSSSVSRLPAHLRAKMPRMLALALILPVLAASPAASPDPGLILEGATVYVSAQAQPGKADILVRGGKIEFAGEPGRARAMAPRASRVDLSGSTVFPGWADAHGHLSGLGQALESADLRGAADAAEASRRIAAVAATLPAGTWARGSGWDQNRWPGQRFPEAYEDSSHAAI